MTYFHPSFKTFEPMIKTKDVQIFVSKFFTSQWNTMNFQKNYIQFIEIII